MKSTFKPVILVILDGWGMAPPGPGNAITQAKLPNFNSLWAAYPHTTLTASGEGVGLPHGEMGNSETGHLNLGAGRIVYQDLPRINMSIVDGSFFKIPAFLEAIEHVKKFSANLHLIGLIGQGGVHSSTAHLLSLLRLCQEKGLKGNVFLHLFTDGRDSPPTTSVSYLAELEARMKTIQTGQIATITGRYYALDRDNHWERTEKAYRAMVSGEGQKVENYHEAIQQSYQKQITDEFLEPMILVNSQGQPVAKINNNDSVIFFNFRIDRPRQLTKAFVIPQFENLLGKKVSFDPYSEKYYKKTEVEQIITKTFARGPALQNLFFVTMTEYEKGLPVRVAFPPNVVQMPLGRIISEHGLRQLRITETEKERFVTYYFNGQREDAFPSEDRIIIPSPQVATYDLKPEMSAHQITEFLLSRIREGIYDFILVNYANPDMVGHTGVLSAGIKACEEVDQCLGLLNNAISSVGGLMVVTADHGNVEEMINPKTGEPDTEHSINPVPFILVSGEFLSQGRVLERGVLGDVAPTVLSFLGINKPEEMLASQLIR